MAMFFLYPKLKKEDKEIGKIRGQSFLRKV
jgi:hypothetical protein